MASQQSKKIKNKKDTKTPSNTALIMKTILITIIALALIFFVWNTFVKGTSTSPMDYEHPQRPGSNESNATNTTNTTTTPQMNTNTTTPPANKKPYMPSPEEIQNTNQSTPANTQPPNNNPSEENQNTNIEELGFDSDYGENYSIKGTCSDFTRKYSVNDTCLTKTTLREFEFAEYFGFTECWYSDINCTTIGKEGCYDGACVDTIASSGDTKNNSEHEGYDVWANGNCTDAFGTYEELCSNNILNEWHIENNRCVQTIYFCNEDCAQGACIGEATRMPNQDNETPVDCLQECQDKGYLGYRSDITTQSRCENQAGEPFPKTEWTQNDCCCYFAQIDKDEIHESEAYLIPSTCYSDVATSIDDYCTNRDILNEALLGNNREGNTYTCFYEEFNCSSLGSFYECHQGACVEVIQNCNDQCLSSARATSGTCEVGRGTGDSVCLAEDKFYESQGDQFCETGYCCCST